MPAQLYHFGGVSDTSFVGRACSASVFPLAPNFTWFSPKNTTQQLSDALVLFYRKGRIAILCFDWGRRLYQASNVLKQPPTEPKAALMSFLPGSPFSHSLSVISRRIWNLLRGKSVFCAIKKIKPISEKASTGFPLKCSSTFRFLFVLFANSLSVRFLWIVDFHPSAFTDFAFFLFFFCFRFQGHPWYWFELLGVMSVFSLMRPWQMLILTEGWLGRSRIFPSISQCPWSSWVSYKTLPSCCSSRRNAAMMVISVSAFGAAPFRWTIRSWSRAGAAASLGIQM